MSLEFTHDFDADLAKFTLEDLAGEFTRVQQQYLDADPDVLDVLRSYKNYVEDLYVRKQIAIPDIDAEIDDAYGGMNIEEIFNKEVDKPLE